MSRWSRNASSGAGVGISFDGARVTTVARGKVTSDPHENWLRYRVRDRRVRRQRNPGRTKGDAMLLRAQRRSHSSAAAAVAALVLTTTGCHAYKPYKSTSAT